MSETPFEMGAENLVDALDTVGATTLRLFGYRRDANGWTRDPQPLPLDKINGPTPGPVKNTNDKLQWVPKFHGDNMPNVEPLDTSKPSNVYGDNGVNKMEYDPVRGKPREYVYFKEGDRTYKLDKQTREVIWSRWSV